MAADGVFIKLQGFEQTRATLRALPDKLRKKVLMSSLRKAARVVQRYARQYVPVLKAPAKYRTKGLLKRRIAVRESRESRQQGNLGVFVNIKPADRAKYATDTVSIGRVKIKQRRLVKASQRGARSPNDPFYWRFVEFGTRRMPAVSFIGKAGERLDEALAVFERDAVDAIENLNRTGV